MNIKKKADKNNSLLSLSPFIFLQDTYIIKALHTSLATVKVSYQFLSKNILRVRASKHRPYIEDRHRIHKCAQVANATCMHLIYLPGHS